MTRTLGRTLLAIGVYAALSNTSALAQDKHDHDHGHDHKHGQDHDHAAHGGDDGDHGMDPAMMEKWSKFAAPGAHHKHLEHFVGDFEYVNKWRMAPEAPWTESSGVTKSRWLMDGRYVVDETEGLDPAMPFKGMGVTGYDNMKKKYVSVWFDNMGTGLMLSEGTCDSSGKEFTYTGKLDDPMTGRKDVPFKFVIKVINAEKHMMEWWAQAPDGKMFKQMEINYTRKS